MGKKEIKTNAMRILDSQKIPYEYETYTCDEFTDGIQVADMLGYEHGDFNQMSLKNTYT